MRFEIKEKQEQVNKTIRFPSEIVDRVNKVIKDKNISFSEFVRQAIEYYLEK